MGWVLCLIPGAISFACTFTTGLPLSGHLEVLFTHIHRDPYTQTPILTNTHTHKHPYTQTPMPDCVDGWMLMPWWWWYVNARFVQAGKFWVKNESKALFGDPQEVHLVCENIHSAWYILYIRLKPNVCFFSHIVIGRHYFYSGLRWAWFSWFLRAMPEQMHRRLIFTWIPSSPLLIALWLSATGMVMLTLFAAAWRLSSAAALREILCCFFVFVEYFYLESVLYFVTPWRSSNSRCASLRWNSIICVLLCIDVQQLPMWMCALPIHVNVCAPHEIRTRSVRKIHTRTTRRLTQTPGLHSCQVLSVTMKHGLEARRI